MVNKVVKVIRICGFCLLLCFVWINDLPAEEILTWDSCVEETRANNPELASAREKIIQKQADRSIAISGLLPYVDTDFTESRRHADDSGTTRGRSYGISGRQLVFDGFKTVNDIKAASRSLDATQYNYAVVSSNTRLDLGTAFTELLRAQRLIKITEDIAKRRRQNYELVKLRYQGGREHRGSLLTADADLAQAELEVVEAGRNIRLSRRRLNKVLGRETYSPVVAEGDFDNYETTSEQPYFEYLAYSNPLLRELIAKEEAAQYYLRSSKSEFFPTVYLGAGASRTDTNRTDNNDEWSVRATVSLPLFEGGSRFAGVSRAKAVLAETRADKRSGRDGIVFQMEDTWIKYHNAIDAVSVRQKYLQATEERAKISRAQYSTGLVSFDNWIIIEDDLVRAKKAYLNVQAEVLVREAYWIQAKGGTLEYENEE